jgi:hypothetical protein
MDNVVLLSITTDDLRELITGAVTQALQFQTPTPATPSPQPDEYLSRDEARRLLHLSLPTLRNLEKRGVLVPSRIARRVLYSRADIARVLLGRKER